MDQLIHHEEAKLRSPLLLMAFTGWSDAQDIATGAVRYLVDRLEARKLAEIDPEEFYDFNTTRPIISVVKQGIRQISWPKNEFYCWSSGTKAPDLLMFLGEEPNLRWRLYSEIIVKVAKQHKVKQAMSLGAFLDVIPHTRSPRVTGSSEHPELKKILDGMGILLDGNYQGPTGINSVVLQELKENGIATGGLWGRAPHYLQATPNPRVSLALLSRLKEMFHFEVDLKELNTACDKFDTEIGQIVKDSPEVSSYLERLEERYDQVADGDDDDLPTPQALVRDLEEFLKSQRDDEPSGGR